MFNNQYQDLSNLSYMNGMGEGPSHKYPYIWHSIVLFFLELLTSLYNSNQSGLWLKYIPISPVI